MVAMDNLDEVIALIRKSENPKAAKAALMERFALSDAQAQAILDMRLQRLTNLEILALRKEYEDLKKRIAELEAILASEKKLMNVIKKELRAVAERYGDERRTEIVRAGEVVEAAAKEEIIAEDALVTYSRAGLLRRVYPPRARRQAAEEGAEDAPLYRFDTQTDHTLYFFTDRGNCYPLSVAALPEMKPKDRGALLSGVLAGLEENETPVNILCMKPSELASAPDLLFVTRKGQVKRTAAAEYDVRRAKFAALTLREGDAVMGVVPLDAAADVLIISRSGMSVRFHADGVPAQGRTAGGVKGMTLEPGDAVLWCGQPQAADQVFLMTERGFAKRVLYMDFEPQARGGRGVKAFYFNKSGSNGTCVAGAALLAGDGAGAQVRVEQRMSPPTVLAAQEAPLQGKQDKGLPLVMALMDDVVTAVEGAAESTGETGE